MVDVKRLVRLAEAKVPIAFIEKSANLEEALEKAKKELPEEEYKKVEEYVKNIPKDIPPDVQGKRWSYYKAVDLINNYWREVITVARLKPEYREALQNLIGEELENIKFNNYEVQYALGLKYDPQTIRSTKLLLILLLLKIGIERGDIGRTGRTEVVMRIIDYALKRIKHLDWKSLEKVLKEILLSQEVKV